MCHQIQTNKQTQNKKWTAVDDLILMEVFLFCFFAFSFPSFLRPGEEFVLHVLALVSKDKSPSAAFTAAVKSLYFERIQVFFLSAPLPSDFF